MRGEQFAFRAFILLVIAYGVFLNFNRLGEDSFFIDELYHVYAANSYNENGQFNLPSGEEYTVAKVYTYLVAMIFTIMGVSEYSARLPSLIIGLNLTLMIGFITTKLFNKTIGLFVVLLLLFSPLQIYYNQECRMYTALQFVFFVHILLIYFIFKKLPYNEITLRMSHSFKNTLQYIGFIFAILLSGVVCLYLHTIYILLIPGLITYLLIIAIEKIFLKNKLGHLFYIVFPFFILALIGLTLLIGQKFLTEVYNAFLYLPKWSAKNAESIHYYLTVLRCNSSPILFFLIPIGMVVVVYRFNKVGLYFVIIFSVPFMLLSILPVKAPRYILFIYPMAMIFIAAVFNELINILTKIITEKRVVKFKKIFEHTLIVLLCFLIFANYQYEKIIKWNFLPVKPDWKKVGETLKNKIEKNDLVISDNPIATLYYLGRADFSLDESLLDISIQSHGVNKQGQYIDAYTGAIQVVSIEDIKNLEKKRALKWFIFGHEGSGFNAIKDYIRKIGTRPDGFNTTDKIEVFLLDEKNSR